MRSFGYQKDNQSIPLTVWIEARDAFTTAIRILDVDARLKFLDLLVASSKKDKNPNVEFVTLFASIILISDEQQIFGKIPSRNNDKNSIIFKVGDKEPVACKKNNVLIQISKCFRLRTSLAIYMSSSSI